MNTSKNVRFTLHSVADVDSLPLAPRLRAAVRMLFQEIWNRTPHKIGVSDLQRILGPDFKYQGGETASYTKGVRPGQSISIFELLMSEPKDMVIGGFHVVVDFCFNYVPVLWNMSIADGHVTFTPELEAATMVGEIPFDEIMPLIQAALVPQEMSTREVITSLEDHPELLFAFKSEEKDVMREYILGLAAKYDLVDEIILPAGFAAVDTDDLRDLLEKVGYDADEFEIEEEPILLTATAVADGSIPAKLASAQRELLEKVGYDADEFEVEEELILRVAKATMEAEDRFLGIA